MAEKTFHNIISDALCNFQKKTCRELIADAQKVYKALNANPCLYRAGRKPSVEDEQKAREILRNIGNNQYKNALYQIFTHLSEKQDLSREEYLMFNSLLYLWNMTY